MKKYSGARSRLQSPRVQQHILITLAFTHTPILLMANKSGKECSDLVLPMERDGQETARQRQNKERERGNRSKTEEVINPGRPFSTQVWHPREGERNDVSLRLLHTADNPSDVEIGEASRDPMPIHPDLMGEIIREFRTERAKRCRKYSKVMKAWRRRQEQRRAWIMRLRQERGTLIPED